ncbi:MAG: helix-turn-helix transcriptional regulator [Burkholderiales bacterium]|nr:helix-turn-helix transcriptional regulator [Burkholderiales bacterium]
MLAEVSPSTASAHLSKLREQNLLTMLAQGKHRYYQLSSLEVASALEALMNIASLANPQFKPSTPLGLRRARTCYDHMAGEMAVALHDAFLRAKWLIPGDAGGGDYKLSDVGRDALLKLGVVLEMPKNSRRRYACTCLDWSERRAHLGGALGANLLNFFRAQAWVEADLDSRALSITQKGERQFAKLLSSL